MKTLAHDPLRRDVQRRLRALRPDSRARWGRMTAHQMVRHLGDSCRMATGEKRPQPLGSLRDRTLLKWVALYLPVRWPEGFQTVPELDQQRLQVPTSDFTSDVEAVVALLDEMAGKDSGFAWPPHPIFGPLSRSAWLRWAWLHTDHHLRQFGA